MCAALVGCALTHDQAPQRDFSLSSIAGSLAVPQSRKKSAAAHSVAQPTQLTVIDRATAKQDQPPGLPPDGRSQFALNDPSQDLNSAIRADRRYAMAGRPDQGVSDSIQQAAFQSPSPRVYNSPSIQPSMMNPDTNVGGASRYQGYPPNYPPSYPPNTAPNYPPSYPPNTSPNYPLNYSPNTAPNYPPQHRTDGYQAGPLQESSRGLDEVWVDQSSQESPNQLRQEQVSSYPPQSNHPQQEGYPQPGDYSQQPGDPGDQWAGNYYSDEPNSGRGYLQQGSGMQGRRLSSNPQTATERALELRNENARLRDAVTRTESELKNRTDELVAARKSYRDKEAELVRTLNRVNELNTQLLRTKGDLKVANQEKANIKRRADEQLKAIESTLDGVLLNSISQNGER